MRDKLFIDGKWVSPVEGGTSPLINPATEEVIHHVGAGSGADIDHAVAAARKAFDEGDWPKLGGVKRARFLRSIAGMIKERSPELSRLEVINNGKPMPEALWDIGDAAGCFEFYAGLAEGLDNSHEEDIPLSDDRFVAKAVREPVGVAGAIIPWNYPMLMAAWKVAPALAAGCTVVLKPAGVTPLTALELAAIADDVGLPPGVLNVVTGPGSKMGARISEHPDVDKVAFTGSVAVGCKIMTAAARDIKNISLELGGKSPFVIFGDSNIDEAVEWIMFGIFWNQGEVCSATSRVLVEEPIYDQLLENLSEASKGIRIGNGLETGVQLGPLVSSDQHRSVLAAIERGKSDGATVVHGGRRPKGLEKGYFVEPTILTDMTDDSWIWKEEIFGPVVCVKPFKTEAEAIRMANDSRYGLAAAVMSKDDARCERVARAFRAGIVWINCSQPTFTEAPWGGYKQSGVGRELGRWGLENYLEIKQITRFKSEKPWGWYLK